MHFSDELLEETKVHLNRSMLSKLFNLLCVLQMGANIREFFSLIENFIDMIGRQMRDFQDIYEVTENLGECESGDESSRCACVRACLTDVF